MDITWRDFSGEGKGRNSRGKVQGRRSMVSRHNVDRELKNGMGNRGLRELICTTHGYGLRGECWRVGGQGRAGIEGQTLGKL